MFYLIILSCKYKEEVVDVSHISAKAEIVRFDQALFSLDTNNWDRDLAILKGKYPHFWEIYSTHVLPLTPDSNMYDKALRAFKTIKTMRTLPATTEILTGDTQR